MAGREKSATGIVRGRYRFDEAKSAIGALNLKLDEAIDEVRLAFQRESQMNDADSMARQDEAKRAPVLENRRRVPS